MFSPRTSIVYDLMGNGKTAIRFGYNRFGVAATTTLASLYDPAAGTIISAHGTMDRQERRRHRAGWQPLQLRGRRLRDQLRGRSQPTSASSRWRALIQDLTRPYVDQFNLGVTREIMRGVSVSLEWFHNDARNSFERNNVLRPGTYSNGTVTNASYRPVTVFSPIDGTPITVYDTVSSAVASAVKNVDTNDSNVKQAYNAFEFNFQARLPHGARLFGGSATDRTIANTCSGAAIEPELPRHRSAA